MTDFRVYLAEQKQKQNSLKFFLHCPQMFSLCRCLGKTARCSLGHKSTPSQRLKCTFFIDIAIVIVTAGAVTTFSQCTGVGVVIVIVVTTTVIISIVIINGLQFSQYLPLYSLSILQPLKPSSHSVNAPVFVSSHFFSAGFSELMLHL